MKVERENLIADLECVIQDEFVAKIEKNENGLTLAFLNGQTFQISVEEI